MDWQAELDKRGLMLNPFNKKEMKFYIGPTIEYSFPVSEFTDLLHQLLDDKPIFCELFTTDEHGNTTPSLRFYVMGPETDEVLASRLCTEYDRWFENITSTYSVYPIKGD